jgi:antitoxin (DNA-binding transcriptional repressor) of toxin-antitoxin stability system
MKAMAVGEFKTHFSEILEEVRQGQKVGICMAGQKNL